jgi:hypothetical protein
VIPANWEESHAVVVGKTFTADVIVWAAADDSPSINADLSYSTASDTQLYDDTARIQVLNIGDSSKVFGEEYQSKAGYLVVIDREADSDIDRGCVVEVTKSSDPSLLEAGRRLAVARVDRGSLRWERDLYCVDTVTTP